MMRSKSAFLPLCLLPLVLIMVVSDEQKKPNVLQMDEHHCLGPAWVADGKRFRYIYRRKSSIIPTKTYYYGQYPYLYASRFKKGQTLHFLGRFDFKKGGEFEINLMGGTPVNEDNAGTDVLQIKFTFDSRDGRGGLIFFNTRKKGNWFDPIKINNPFNAETSFVFTIFAMNSKFEIRTYGSKVLEYHYRVPLDYITMVNALGNYTTPGLIYLGGQVMKSPLKIILPDGALNVGDNIQFDGVPGYFGFEMHFHNGNNDDIILQIKVNMEDSLMTLNSRFNSVWGTEQRVTGFRFETGRAFDMEMRWTQTHIDLHVDTVWVATWWHKVNATDYGEVHIKGAVELRSFIICANYKYPWWVGKDFVKYGGLITKL